MYLRPMPNSFEGRTPKVQTAVVRSKQNYQTLLRLDEEALVRTLFPEQSAVPVLVKPDYEKIHKELLRHGVILRL